MFFWDTIAALILALITSLHIVIKNKFPRFLMCNCQHESVGDKAMVFEREMPKKFSYVEIGICGNYYLGDFSSNAKNIITN